MKRSFKKYIRIISVITISSLFSFVHHNNSFALREYYEAPGAITYGVPANCYGNAYQGLCGSPAGIYGGGASWRVFSVKNKAPGLDDYSGYGGNILTESLKDEILDACGDIGAKWIISFGWDGMYGSAYGYDNFSFQIGPARRDVGIVNGSARNEYGQKSISNEKTKSDGTVYYEIDESKFANNIRISDFDAILAYHTYVDPLKWYIPNRIGAFCAKTAESNSFQAKAFVSEGAWKTATNKANTGWTNGNGTASINMKSTNDGVLARFFLVLRSRGGPGTTSYAITANKNSTLKKKKLNSTATLDGDSSGDHVLKGTGGYNGLSGYIDPGETYCANLHYLPNSTKKTVKRVNACATALVTNFYGYSAVSGAVSGNTDWLGNNSPKNLSVNCTNGCTVTFNHYIKSDDNKGSTTYSIYRSSNYSQVSSGYLVSNKKLNAPSAGTTGLNKDVVSLVPGMKVCETLKYDKDNDTTKNTGTQSRTVCVHATGDARNIGDDAFINIKVRNNSVTKYNNYQEAVYAKPTDNVEYKPNYAPTLQYTHSIIPDHIQIDNGTTYDETSSSRTLREAFNAHRDTMPEWNNAFGVNSTNFLSSKFSQGYAFGVGSISADTDDKTNVHRVSNDEVGRSLEEIASINVDVDSGGPTRTTPSQVSFNYSGNKFISKVITAPLNSKGAYAHVPYNFNTSISLKFNSAAVNDKNVPIFASGEGGSADIDVKILPRENSYTTNDSNDKYATNAIIKTRLVLFVPNDKDNIDLSGGDISGDSLCNKYNNYKLCQQTNESDEITTNSNLTVDQVKNGKTEFPVPTIENQSFSIPDLDAGTTVCVAAAVYPFTSGLPTNLSKKGDNKWNLSEAKCFIVYKKPSLQAWGGNVFSAGPLSTPLAEKRHIKGVNDFDVNNKNVRAAFGSFTELGLMPLKEVEGFASGAATGFDSNNSGSLRPSENGNSTLISTPGGFADYDSSFCNLSRLTFGNYQGRSSDCKSSVPGLGGSSRSSVNTDITSLVSTFVNMSDDEATEKSVTVLKKSSNYELNGDEYSFDNGQTIVIYAKDPNSNNYYDVTIRNNIEYPIEKYYDLSDIPKMIIFANNIRIDCSVTRIDAVLIAKETVDTCYDVNDVNHKDRSNQLRINGSVITGKLKANRTYGAATGSNSIVPAEIINYDTTLYLWGAKKADVTETGKLDTTYLRELAPKR